MTTWADWVTAPPCTLAFVLWLAFLVMERWFAAWVLTYVAQGLVALSVIPYLVAGEPGAAIPLAVLWAALLYVRRVFRTDGPRPRRRKTRKAPDYQAPGEWWRMYTVWAWHQNRALAMLLWMAWGMILAGLSLILVYFL